MTVSASDLSLHERIFADLAAEITSGAWPPGHRIPFETELRARYGCARATANRAVRALADAGLVERRRRAGTFVARPHIQTAVLEIPDIEAEIKSRGQAYRFTGLSQRVRRGAGGPEEIQLGRPHRLLEIRGVHVAASRPFALEDRIISLDAVPLAADLDLSRGSPGAWLLSHVAWTEARHEISAVNPSPAEAEVLGIRPSHACLSVRRWTWRMGAGITYARQLFPGEALDLTARFTPGSR